MKLRLAKKILSQSERNTWNAAVIRYYLLNVREHHVDLAENRIIYSLEKEFGFQTKRNIRMCERYVRILRASNILNTQISKCK